jgi:cytochrome c2
MKTVYIAPFLLASTLGIGVAGAANMQGMNMKDMPMQTMQDNQKHHATGIVKKVDKAHNHITIAQQMGSMREMMRGMKGDHLPPGIDPALLPDPNAKGARLLGRYCIQCHNLPGPGMHTAAEWPQVLGRMNMRMQMMGGMMGGMMMGGTGLAAPNRQELEILLAYLQKHAQEPIDAAKYPDLNTQAGQAFSAICMQCHALPDPRQHTAQEWPAVVGRMRGNMTTMGKIVPDETTTEEIIDFLRRHGLTD